MSSEFNVSKKKINTVQCHGNINIISIRHIDIDSNNYGSLTLHYSDGTNLSIRFKGNGGLTFSYNNIETDKLTKGTWDLQKLLQLPVFFTAICLNTYAKNTWEFCTSNYLSSVDFFTNTIWSGMNSVKIFSSLSIPLYFTAPVTSMQEHGEKIIVSASDMYEGYYLKNRLENFHKNKFYGYESVKIDVSIYPNSNKFVFKSTGNIKELMNIICGSKNFFSDENGFVCCKTWYDFSLMNIFMGTKLPLEQDHVAHVPRVTVVRNARELQETNSVGLV